MKKAWIGIIAVLVAGVFFAKVGLFDSSVAEAPASEEIRILLSEISETATWHEYTSGGTVIRFFVVKAGDGSIKTGFDACDFCYKERKGYRQEGQYMVCNNCGNKYPITGLGTENKTGGCWPGYLPSHVDGDYLVMKVSDIEKGRWMFP